MKISSLFKRTIYQDLRSSIGYFDARRIIRFVEEEADKVNSIEDLNKLLKEKEFDDRQILLTEEILKKIFTFTK